MARNAEMARDAAQIGGYLECQKRQGLRRGNVCGFRIHIDEEPAKATVQVRGYLRTGWPQHCGQTMTWVTAFEAAHGPEAMREPLLDDPASDAGRVEGRDPGAVGV